MTEKQLNIKVPGSLKALVDSEARKHSMRMSDLIIQYIEKGLNSNIDPSRIGKSELIETPQNDAHSSPASNPKFSISDLALSHWMNHDALLMILITKLCLVTERDSLPIPTLNGGSLNPLLYLSFQEQLNDLSAQISAISLRLDQMAQVNTPLSTEDVKPEVPVVTAPLDDQIPSADSLSSLWLTLHQAYTFAQVQGFSESLEEFAALSKLSDYPEQYASWGLVADLSRRNEEDPSSTWFITVTAQKNTVSQPAANSSPQPPSEPSSSTVTSSPKSKVTKAPSTEAPSTAKPKQTPSPTRPQTENKQKGAKSSDTIVCPHCHSSSLNKNGVIQGQQRYKCKDCKKAFKL